MEKFFEEQPEKQMKDVSPAILENSKKVNRSEYKL
jgi:hypothetical protein